MDLRSRLRSIVRPPGAAPRELTYEPDTEGYEAPIDHDRVADVLGGCAVVNAFGRALVIDRRYESDRFHGQHRVGDCELRDDESLRVLDPSLGPPDGSGSRTLFIDLETTGLSGGAGTVAFLVGCGWFDIGAFQVRQFLLTSYAAERALLCAVAECFDDAALIVTYNGKTFDVPVMETRWLFHRMELPLDGVRHFDMLHPARRLWRSRSDARVNEPPEGTAADRRPRAPNDNCRLGTLERVLCGVTRVGDVPGMEIPARYFRFLRSGDARPLEPVLEHNRLDLISLAAVAARASQLVQQGSGGCRDAAEALALGKVFERADRCGLALEAYERAASDVDAPIEVVAEALYRFGLRLRRDRRFAEAADIWRRIVALKQGRRRSAVLVAVRRFAVEALAVHHEHRERDYEGAKELALLLLDESVDASVQPQADAARHRIARLDRKLANGSSELFV
ncbi:MAG: ribonuclease H-like domain-containing protein [Vicinamibacterales bacterium]